MDFSVQGPRLPVELQARILEFAIEGTGEDHNQVHGSPEGGQLYTLLCISKGLHPVILKALYRAIRIRHGDDLDYLSRLASTLSSKSELARLVRTIVIPSGRGSYFEDDETGDYVCFVKLEIETIKYILSSCSVSNLSLCLCNCSKHMLYSLNCENLLHLDFCLDEFEYDDPSAGEDLLARVLPQLHSLSVGRSALKHLATVLNFNTAMPLSLRRFDMTTCISRFRREDFKWGNPDDEAQPTAEGPYQTPIRALWAILLRIGKNLEYLDLTAIQRVSPDNLNHDFTQFGELPNLKILAFSLKGVPSRWKSEYMYLQSLPALETVIFVEEGGHRELMTLPNFLSFLASPSKLLQATIKQ